MSKCDRSLPVILGAGITGLTAGFVSGMSVYEAKEVPGGICLSYYLRLADTNRFYTAPSDSKAYRFEIGGGHWIFGADDKILKFINSLSLVKNYNRKSAVFFPDKGFYVPYPIQNHLYFLPEEIREKILKEILQNYDKNINTVSTMADWLELNFGETLCELFFFPFHEIYTAGLYKEIAPQDKFKTPLNKELIIKGAKEKTSEIGYNTSFLYPKEGLDCLIRTIEKKCKVYYNKKVVKIDIRNKEILFEDGSERKYEKLISTLPLNKVVQMTNIEIDEPLPPYTSVSVINIGAKKGKMCPEYHWIYIPKSNSKFYRVGFYSNVDNSFLPLTSRNTNDRVGIYVEKAYKGGYVPTEKEIEKLCEDVSKELQNWKFIEEIEVIDHTFVEIAYTWQYPTSPFVSKAINTLKKYDIYQTGRYGKWKFQGIAESIKDGLTIKNYINTE